MFFIGKYLKNPKKDVFFVKNGDFLKNFK